MLFKMRGLQEHLVLAYFRGVTSETTGIPSAHAHTLAYGKYLSCTGSVLKPKYADYVVCPRLVGNWNEALGATNTCCPNRPNMYY